MAGFRTPGVTGQAGVEVATIDLGTAALLATPAPGTVGSARPARLAPLVVDATGHVKDAKVVLAIRPEIEHVPMPTIHGIIVHQTGGSTAKGSLDSYLKKGANGAHFLIDKDGTIYQTASVLVTTHHVGQLKSRCRAELHCTPAEAKALVGKGAGKPTGHVEAAKSWPGRYPGNGDSLGIEFASLASPKPGGKADEFVYEKVTPAQQAAFDWLLPRLLEHFQLRASEIFRHPDVSWKQPSEAASVHW